MKLERSILTLLFALPACTPDVERESELSSLRVLAVQKDLPYARPGETVTLTMLDVDASDTASPRPLERFWLAGCENPDGDTYLGCAEQFGKGAMPQTGSGSRFSFTLSQRIIEDHDPPIDPKQPNYGVAYVFFAVCAGHLEPATGKQASVFPFVCKSKNNRLLGAKDFVVGYTAVYGYESLRNENPIITGFAIKERTVQHDCIGLECVPSPGGVPLGDAGVQSDAGDASSEAGLVEAGLIDAGLVEGGVPAPDASAGGAPDAAPNDADAAIGPEICKATPERCIDVCTKKKEDCPKISIRPIVDRKSAEIDAVLATGEQKDVREQMWVNYYADRGSFTSEVRLLNDADKGWNEEYDTDFRAPKEPGPVRIWAAAHDNRGGVQWVRVTLYAK